MKEIKNKEWSELASIWNVLIDGNPIATPFQSYKYLTFTGKGKPLRNDLFRTLGLQELNLVLYVDHTPIAIAPMLFKKQKGKTTVYFRGHFTVANHLDFIYANLSYDDFVFLMDSIRSLLGDVAFFLDRVYCQSPTSEYLKRYLPSALMQEHECFAVPVPKTYDDWYQSLTKSRREKIRQSNNRIANDHAQCSVSYFAGEKIKAATYREIISVYADRFLVKNHYIFGSFNHLAKKVLQVFLLKDKMTQWLNNANNSFHVVVYINHEVAAFSSGLISKDKRILGCRFAIYTKYKRYTPGAILISSTIGYLVEQKAAGKLDIAQLDMGQGGDGGMTYKSTYGGEVYSNYTFIE